jgi:hypothetical protein
MKTAFDLIPSFFVYVKKRNEILIKFDLSLGDYFYYYVLAYNSFLKRSVSDGPPFNIVVSQQGDGDIITFKNENEGEKDHEKIIEESKRKRKLILTEKINRLFIKFFENGLSTPDSAKYQIYSEELSKLKNNEMRIPWKDGLPESVNSFFSKFDLEKTYNPMINSIEMELITND